MGVAKEWPPARTFARATSVLAAAVSVSVLAGWLFNPPILTEIVAGWPRMVPATALAMGLCALALWFAIARQANLARGFAIAVVAIGTARLVDDWLGLNLRLDHFGLQRPGRMAPATATAFILLGTALAISLARRPGRVFQALAYLVLLIGWLGVSRYAYGGSPLLPYATMALHTATLFMLLAAATLATRSDVGLVSLLASSGTGGASARRLLPAAVLFPLAVGWLPLHAERAGWIGAEAGISVFALATVVGFSALVWANARWLERTERAGEDRLRLTVDAALDAVITIDRAGAIVAWNGQADAIFGWTREQVMGRALADVIVPERYRAAHRRGLAHYLQTGEARVLNRRIELEALHRERGEFPIEIAITPIGAGASLAFSAFVRDISQRRTAETALRASESRFRTLAESLPQLIWTCRPDGWCDYLSRQWVAYTGRPEEQQIGYGWADHLHPDDRERVQNEWAAATGRGDYFDIEFRIRRHDGVYRWFKTRAVPLRDAGGEIVKWFGSNTDFENEKQAQGRLRTQLERMTLLDRTTRAIGQRQDLRSILQAVLRNLEEEMPIDFGCVCLCESGTQILTVACVGARSERLARELAIPEHATLPADTNGLARCLRGELVHEPDITQAQFPFPSRLASAGLGSLVAAPLGVEGTVFGVVIAARRGVNQFTSGDCEFLRQLGEHVALASRQAQLHDALQRAYEDLKQSQQVVLQQERLRALGQMATGIAHDINNALSPAALYAQSLLESDRSLSPQATKCLKIIDRAIHDVAHTVARMRDFSRQREEQTLQDPVDLNVLIGQVVELTRVRWSDMPQERGIVIELRSELATDLPAVQGVDNEIRDALTNIVLNAVDAMPDGGVLTVRTRAVDGGDVQLEVCDSGVGMSEETRARCLEPFFTTKGERGTGLGLAMVYAAVRRHRAQVQIDSELGKGTTVRLVFPGGAEVSRASSAPRAAVPSRNLRLLVIDDDPLVLQSLRDTLEGDGHSVVACDGGQAGIDAFNTALGQNIPFAAVITDLGMPHVDGRKVARAIKARSPRTPVILLTGWGHRMIAEEDMPGNVDRLLSKPPMLPALRAALAELTEAP